MRDEPQGCLCSENKTTSFPCLSVQSGQQLPLHNRKITYLERNHHNTETRGRNLPASLHCKQGNHTPPTASSNSKADKHFLWNQNGSEQAITENCKTNSTLWALSATAPGLHVPQCMALSFSPVSSQALVSWFRVLSEGWKIWDFKRSLPPFPAPSLPHL